MAAGGAGMFAGTGAATAPARRLALVGALGELAAQQVMVRRMPTVVARSYREGRADTLLKLGQGLALAGTAASLLARRSRVASWCAGGSLLAASACTRFGIFHAGVQSARDPEQTTAPQRARLGGPDEPGVDH
jgi:hypothetical protein